MSLPNVDMIIEDKGNMTTVLWETTQVRLKRGPLLRVIDSISCCLSSNASDKLHHLFGYSKLKDSKGRVHYIDSNPIKRLAKQHLDRLKSCPIDFPTCVAPKLITTIDQFRSIAEATTSQDIFVKYLVALPDFMTTLKSVRSHLPVPEYEPKWDSKLLTAQQKGNLLIRLGVISDQARTEPKGLVESINLRKDLGGGGPGGSLAVEVHPGSDIDFSHLCHQILFLMTSVEVGVQATGPGISDPIQQGTIDRAREYLFEVLPGLSPLKKEMISSFFKNLPPTERGKIPEGIMTALMTALNKAPTISA